MSKPEAAIEVDLTTLLAGAEEGEKIDVLGDLVTVKVPSSATGGAYFAFEELTLPGEGPPPHFHAQAEVFYVLEGDVDFLRVSEDGEHEWLKGGPGAVCAIPPMAHHTFRNSGSTQSRVFVVTMPGGMDGFFRAVGKDGTGLVAAPGLDGPPDEAKIAAASEKYGVYYLP